MIKLIFYKNYSNFIPKKIPFHCEMGFVLYHTVAASIGKGIWFRSKSSKDS